MTDTERLEHYVAIVASDEDRLMISEDTEDGPRDVPVWFWENDPTDAEYPTFREAIDADIKATRERESAVQSTESQQEPNQGAQGGQE